LLTAGVALWRLWQQQGGTNPVALAGHSLGEYTALTCAQAISLADAVRLVTQRGELMQQAVPVGSGAMAAIIGLNEQQVETACQQAAEGQVVAPANYNAPDQVVIAGQAEAVKRAMTACQQAGARRTLPLPVSVPSHCELMRPAAVELQQSLDQIPIAEPQLPVFNNVDGQTATDPTQIRQRLVEQLYQPVQWVKLVKQMIASKGINHLIECGPGRVLTGLGPGNNQRARGL
jgi:[acyl-carrier-protein] S-malonyltransferase